MTNELLALAGRATDNPFKGLTFRDLIEFAERFGVGVEEINALPASEDGARLRGFCGKQSQSKVTQNRLMNFLTKKASLMSCCKYQVLSL
jgi:hypothetical protein